MPLLLTNDKAQFSLHQRVCRCLSVCCIYTLLCLLFLADMPGCFIYGKDLSCDMTKPTKWVCAQRRLRSAWASLLCAQWVAKNPSFLHADSEDSDQTGRMPRLIWVFAGRTAILLVLSCRGSFGSNAILLSWFILFITICPLSIFY